MVLTPPGVVSSPIFAPARLQARNLSPALNTESIFLPPPSSGFTSNSQTSQFDKVAKRGNSLDMC
jgi:hypothetical protein